MLFPEEWQVQRLRQLIEVLRLEQPDVWRRAERAARLGQSDQYFEWLLWLWGIDKKYWIMYNESQYQFELENAAEHGLFMASAYVGELQRYFYETTTIRRPALSESVLALRSPYRVSRPMKKLQLHSFTGAVVCAMLSLSAAARLRVGSAAVFSIAAMDLQTVSFNCYEPRYGDLCADALFGNMNRVSNTVYSTIKSTLGITPLTSHPLLRMNSEINWNVLFSTTLTSRLFHQVSLNGRYTQFGMFFMFFFALCSASAGHTGAAAPLRIAWIAWIAFE